MRLSNQRGFSYLIVLFTLAIVGTGFAAVGTAWSETRRREAEMDLLRVGTLYARAIADYYRSAPGSEQTYPRELSDLLEDRRYAGTRRYLRTLYPDPISGLSEWGVVRAPDGGIQGVFSLSNDEPLRKTAVDVDDMKLASATRYRDWRFVAPTANQGAK